MKTFFMLLCIVACVDLQVTAQFAVEATNPRCIGECNGSAQISPSVGYYFRWSNGDTTAFADSLCAGIYYCIISDSQDIILDTLFVEIPNPKPDGYYINVFNESCPGAHNGIVIIEPPFPNPPYSYFLGKNDSNFVYSANEHNSFTGLESGSYNMIMINGNGCVQTATLQVTLDSTSCTGINDVTASLNFRLYPNPVNNILQIELQHQSLNSLQITIMDISGQTLSQQTINPAVKNELDVSGLGAGLYFVVLHGENERVVRKFVKE